MKSNHIPAKDRLRCRIAALEIQEDSIWVKSGRGNPYYHCKGCNIHTPEYTNRGYQHFNGCRYQGLKKEIAHYKKLLTEAENTVST